MDRKRAVSKEQAESAIRSLFGGMDMRPFVSIVRGIAGICDKGESGEREKKALG